MAGSWVRSIAMLSMGLFAISGCATDNSSSQSISDSEEIALMEMLTLGRSSEDQARIGETISKASSYPLGSKENPVRADMPAGQREYLNRLRCRDGTPPDYRRYGSLGAGVYGSIVDGYNVTCENSEPSEAVIIMDMYHKGYREIEAVPGFTMAE